MSGTCWRLALACLVGLVLRGDGAEDRHALKQGLTNLADGSATADVSADGRFIAFESRAALLPTDVNHVEDIYVFDRACDRLTLESRGVDGRAANGASHHPRLSADGRYLVFDSGATNIDGAWAYSGTVQVYLSDRLTGAIRLISRTPAGLPGNKWSDSPDISNDGRIVALRVWGDGPGGRRRQERCVDRYLRIRYRVTNDGARQRDK